MNVNSYIEIKMGIKQQLSINMTLTYTTERSYIDFFHIKSLITFAFQAI